MTISYQPKHFKRRDIVLAIVALGVLVYEIWLFTLFLRVPGDGVGVYLGKHVAVTSAPSGSSLQVDDFILKIDTLDVDQHLLQPGFWRAALSRLETQAATYTIQRDGEILEVEVPWRRYAMWPLLWRGGALWIVSLSLIAATLLLLTERQHNLGPWLLGCAFAMLALNQVNNILLAASASVALQWAWLFIPVDAIAVWLAVSFGLQALLLFPETKAPVRKFPRLIWLVHIILPAISLPLAFLLGGDTILSIRDTMFNIANPLMLLGLISQLIALGHTYTTSRQPGVRNQIRWIFWGLALAFVPWLFFYVIPSAIGGSPWLPLSVTSLGMVLIPAAFAVSVFRFGLMDIDFVINRTLVYGALALTSIVLYLVVVSATNGLFVGRTGYANDYAAGIIGTMVLFMVFNPLRNYTQNVVDRVFYRDRLDFNKILMDVGQQLSTTIMLGDVKVLLTEHISQQLGLAFASILLLEEERECYVGAFRKALCVEEDSPLITWFKRSRRPLVVYQRQRLSQNVGLVVEDIAQQGGELCIPLFQRNVLIGLYLFGSKHSGNLLTRDEMNTLVLLGHQAAAAVQNAQLYAELQDYNRMLAARVKARTQELQSERNRLDTILQNIADGLVVTDRKGSVVLVNPAFAQIVKNPVAQIVGRPLREVFPGAELCPLVQDALNHVGVVYTSNITGEGSGGSTTRMYKASSCALVQRVLSDNYDRTNPQDGETLDVLGVVTVLRDISHEIEVDRMKTDFISMVSHELRTPLTSVLGFAKLIHKNFDRDIVPRVAEDDRRGQRSLRRISDNLDIITSEGERLTRLINEVLDIAKMEAGKTDWNMADVPFADVIDTAVHAMMAMSAQKQIPIDVNIEENLPSIYADRDRLVQVVANLLSNALKFTEEGQITVEVRCLASRDTMNVQALSKSRAADVTRLLSRGDWLWVSVSDSGIGIPEDRLPEVFEKFKQVSNTLASKPQGTGLGLPICREIIEHHNGRIWVESELGVGSSFIFMLPFFSEVLEKVEDIPVTEAAVVTRAVPVHVDPATQTENLILVVDDESAIRNLLHQELADAGYRVIEAADGMEALDVARAKHPDLILLDVMIPHITGFDVVSVLKGDSETAQIPIVFLSAIEDRERGFRLGADGYLTKPIDTALLFETISGVLERRKNGHVRTP